MITHGTGGGGWFDGTSPSGVVYRRATVIAYLDNAEETTAAAVRDQRSLRTEAILNELSRIELTG